MRLVDWKGFVLPPRVGTVRGRGSSSEFLVADIGALRPEPDGVSRRMRRLPAAAVAMLRSGRWGSAMGAAAAGIGAVVARPCILRIG
tara:strand:+ start:2240 stop:2500 length:261 start_codon:yes stop_codon:yes gene_type:complete